MPGSQGSLDPRRDRPGERIRCPGCTKPQRHECEGRRDRAGMPLCSCIQCHGAAIRADAELYSEPIVVELRRYVFQQRNRSRLAAKHPQRPRQRTCMGPGCGNQAISRRFGPRRKYCSDACRTRAYRARKRAREQAQRNAVPGQVVTSGPQSNGAGRTAPWTGRGIGGPTQEALRQRREREAWASFGLDDLLDQPPDTGGQAGSTAATGSQPTGGPKPTEAAHAERWLTD